MASIVELTDKQGNVLLPTTVADAVQVGDKTLSEFAESSASNSYDVEEDGFYFVDSEGNIKVSLDSDFLEIGPDNHITFSDFIIESGE